MDPETVVSSLLIVVIGGSLVGALTNLPLLVGMLAVLSVLLLWRGRALLAEMVDNLTTVDS